MKYTHDWFSTHKENWLKFLSRLHSYESISFLEIGCFEGMATNWILEKFPQARIDCVDTFKGSSEHGFDFTKVKDRFLKNTEANKDKITLYVGKSNEVLQILPAGKMYDCIYVDGSHFAKDVLADAVLAWQHLRPRGYMIFDDYWWDQRPLPQENPRLAIDSFLQCMAGTYDLVHMDYQVFIQKKAGI